MAALLELGVALLNDELMATEVVLELLKDRRDVEAVDELTVGGSMLDEAVPIELMLGVTLSDESTQLLSSLLERTEVFAMLFATLPVTLLKIWLSERLDSLVVSVLAVELLELLD